MTGVAPAMPVRHQLNYAAASFAAAAVVGLVSSVVTARLFGAGVIGEYALASAPWLIVVQLSTINEQTAFVRKAALLERRSSELSGLFVVLLGFSFLLTLTVGAVALAISVLLLRGPIHQSGLVVPATLIVLGYVFIDNTSWNIDFLFASTGTTKRLFVGRLVQAVSLPVFAVAFRLAGVRSVWALTIATIASFALAFLVRLASIALVMTRRLDDGQLRRSLRELPEMLRFGLVLLPGGVADGLVRQLGVWILGALESVKEVGAFSRASGVATRVTDLQFRLNEVMLPQLVRHLADGDEDGAKRLLDRTTQHATLFLCLLVTCGAGASTGIMAVYGKGFGSAALALALLLGAFSIGVLASLQGVWFLAVGRPAVAMLFTIARAVTVAVLMAILAPAFSATGVGLALLIGFAGDYVVKIIFIGGIRGGPRGEGPIGRSGTAAITGLILGITVGRILDAWKGFPVGTLASIGASAAVYGLTVIIIDPWSRSMSRRLLARVVRARRPG